MKRPPLALLCITLTSAAAQPRAHQDQPDVERLVRDGNVEELTRVLGGGRDVDDFHALAEAQVNRARRVADPEQRQKAFEDARRRFDEWIRKIETQPGAARMRIQAESAAARSALVGVILSYWAAGDLDELEATGDVRERRDRLQSLLLDATRQCAQAWDATRPLVEALTFADARTEDEYLALGIFETVQRLALELRVQTGWSNLGLALVESPRSTRRAAALRDAERSFGEVLGAGQSGEVAARCALGLAMTLVEQGRFDAARRQFEDALLDAPPGPVAARIRFQHARCELRAGKFEESRAVLRPLVSKDPERLAPEDRPALFYVNLAHLWDANSFLLEAEALEQSAAQSEQKEALQLQARRQRGAGLAKMNRLAARGGPWPELVRRFTGQLEVGAVDEQKASATELLFSARGLIREGKHQEALSRLQIAAGRADAPASVAAEIQFQIGVCRYQLGDLPTAAEAFERVMKSRSEPFATQAAQFAFQLRARIAEDSRRREDYLALAETLRAVRAFPQAEASAEAGWWLPVALQAAGEYRAAAVEFAKIAPASPRWEEAQFRRLLCERRELEREGPELSTLALLARAAALAGELAAFSQAALSRAAAVGEAGSSGAADQTRRRAASALIQCAETQMMTGVEQYESALETLKDFESRFPGSDQLGLVLAARLRALRGLKRFDEAAGVVSTFLDTVASDETGGALATVADGVIDEVRRLENEGQLEQARAFAPSAVAVLERLDAWLSSKPALRNRRPLVAFGLAQARRLAGQLDAALRGVDELIRSDPKNGALLRLRALILTDRLGDAPRADSTDRARGASASVPDGIAPAPKAGAPAPKAGAPAPEALAAAREAWAALLRDPALRSAAPDRYWEARYQTLRLALAAGAAKDVRRGIEQERVWYPDLGGPRWRAAIERLYDEARPAVAEPRSEP